jgi:hypothetical protein
VNSCASHQTNLNFQQQQLPPDSILVAELMATEGVLLHRYNRLQLPQVMYPRVVRVAIATAVGITTSTLLAPSRIVVLTFRVSTLALSMNTYLVTTRATTTKSTQEMNGTFVLYNSFIYKRKGRPPTAKTTPIHHVFNMMASLGTLTAQAYLFDDDFQSSFIQARARAVKSIYIIYTWHAVPVLFCLAAI